MRASIVIRLRCARGFCAATGRSPQLSIVDRKCAEERLISANIPDPVESVRWLFEAAKGDRHVFNSMLDRRVAREPLQYIVGEWDFHNITLVMRPPVLIPRPETEELVELVLQNIATSEPIRILDIGTGTGAIALALAHARKNVSVVALDMDPKACELTLENIRRLKLSERVRVEHSTIQDFVTNGEFDFIVSNPPYIPPCEIDTLQPEVRLFESRQALDGGGSDGGEIPRMVTQRSAQLMRRGGKLFFELHHTHDAKTVQRWVDAFPSLELIESRNDFAGIPRLHVIRKR